MKFRWFCCCSIPLLSMSQHDACWFKMVIKFSLGIVETVWIIATYTIKSIEWNRQKYTYNLYRARWNEQQQQQKRAQKPTDCLIEWLLRNDRKHWKNGARQLEHSCGSGATQLPITDSSRRCVTFSLGIYGIYFYARESGGI